MNWHVATKSNPRKKASNTNNNPHINPLHMNGCKPNECVKELSDSKETEDGRPHHGGLVGVIEIGEKVGIGGGLLLEELAEEEPRRLRDGAAGRHFSRAKEGKKWGCFSGRGEGKGRRAAKVAVEEEKVMESKLRHSQLRSYI